MLHLVTSTKRVSPVSSFSSLERPIRASKAYSTLRIAYSIGSRVRSKYKYEHLLVSPDADLTKDQVSNSSAYNAPLPFSCCDVTCKLKDTPYSLTAVAEGRAAVTGKFALPSRVLQRHLPASLLHVGNDILGIRVTPDGPQGKHSLYVLLGSCCGGHNVLDQHVIKHVHQAGPTPGKRLGHLKEEKNKEKLTLFSDHDGSLLRRQPGAMTIGHSPSWTPALPNVCLQQKLFLVSMNNQVGEQVCSDVMRKHTHLCLHA